MSKIADITKKPSKNSKSKGSAAKNASDIDALEAAFGNLDAKLN
jgi:hypothetical protein